MQLGPDRDDWNTNYPSYGAYSPPSGGGSSSYSLGPTRKNWNLNEPIYPNYKTYDETPLNKPVRNQQANTAQNAGQAVSAAGAGVGMAIPWVGLGMQAIGAGAQIYGASKARQDANKQYEDALAVYEEERTRQIKNDRLREEQQHMTNLLNVGNYAKDGEQTDKRDYALFNRRIGR